MPLWSVGTGGLVVLPCSQHAAGGFMSRSPGFRFLPSNPNDFRKIEIRSVSRRFCSSKVRALENAGQGQVPIAPLQFQSPTGQLLYQIMQTHPHLLPAAIEQQLEQLQSDGDAKKMDKSPPSQDPLLYRRIAEVREKDKRKSLVEIIYCFIVQKFIENNISMIPKISPSASPTSLVDTWPNQGQQLEAIHSPEAMEMIQSHLNLIVGERVIGPLNAVLQISKLKLGKLYAASIMYGYFLKRVDERYQLERTMNTLPKRIPDQRILEGLKPNPFWDMQSLVQISPDGFDGEQDERLNKLKSYVMYLDAETLQRYATIRSSEAISLIEKQTQSLFGQPDIRIAEDGTLDVSGEETVGISFSGLTMLVLEAVAFGSFLWEAESYVESKYHFVTN